MDPQRFDDLTRLLAAGVSRREVLRRAGSGLAAAVLASLLPERAWAGGPQGNDEAAHFCNMVFPEDDPRRGQCKRAATRGGGIYYECGPGAGACPTKVLSGQECVPRCAEPKVLDAETCSCECPPDTEECGGACYEPCPEGQTRNSTTCQCESVCPTCPPGQTACPGSCQCVPCSCWPLVATGELACIGCGTGVACPTGTCPEGQVCVSGVLGPECAPLCDSSYCALC